MSPAVVRLSGAPDPVAECPGAVSGIPDTRRCDLEPFCVACRLRWRLAMARAHTSLTLAAARKVLLLAIAVTAAGACARSARGPPVSVDIALERARQALCNAGGIESPRALVATFEPQPPCTQIAAADRVRCYLARPGT